MTGCSKLYMELDFLCRNFLNSKKTKESLSINVQLHPVFFLLQKLEYLFTVVDHLQIERLSFVDVVEVFHGDDQTQLQNRQT